MPSRRKKTQRKTAKKNSPENALIRLDQCQSQEINWLWHNRIPLGKVTLLVGDPDSGKSFFALDLAARVSSARGLPPEAGLEKPGRVLLLCADDDLHDTILPRLEAANADLSRITLLPSYRSAAGNKPDRLLSLTTELQRFQDAIDSVDDCRLIIIDPITAYLKGAAGYDHYTTRQLLQHFATIAQKKNAAILLISHQRKQGSPTALYRPLGSLAFTAVARVVFLLVNDSSTVGRRLLLPAKMTLHSEPQRTRLLDRERPAQVGTRSHPPLSRRPQGNALRPRRIP